MKSKLKTISPLARCSSEHGLDFTSHAKRARGISTVMDLSNVTLEHWRNGAIVKTHDIVSGEQFLKLVDSIRRNRHQSDGWQLKKNGEIHSEMEVFGKPVYYGVSTPSRFHS